MYYKVLSVFILAIQAMAKIEMHYHYHFNPPTKLSHTIENPCEKYCKDLYPMYNPANWLKSDERTDCITKCNKEKLGSAKDEKKANKQAELCEAKCKKRYSYYDPETWFNSDERKNCMDKCKLKAFKGMGKINPKEKDKKNCEKICEERNPLWEIWNWNNKEDCTADCKSNKIFKGPKQPAKQNAIIGKRHNSSTQEYENSDRILNDSDDNEQDSDFKTKEEINKKIIRDSNENSTDTERRILDSNSYSDEQEEADDNDQNELGVDRELDNDRSRRKNDQQYRGLYSNMNMRILAVTCTQACSGFKKKIDKEVCIKACQESMRTKINEKDSDESDPLFIPE